jgi:hypothetical protein
VKNQLKRQKVKSLNFILNELEASSKLLPKSYSGDDMAELLPEQLWPLKPEQLCSTVNGMMQAMPASELLIPELYSLVVIINSFWLRQRKFTESILEVSIHGSMQELTVLRWLVVGHGRWVQ